MLKAKKKNLTKKEISHQINIKIGLPKSYTEKILDDFIEIMIDCVKANKLIIKNIGAFKIVYKKRELVEIQEQKLNIKLKPENPFLLYYLKVSRKK